MLGEVRLLKHIYSGYNYVVYPEPWKSLRLGELSIKG
jgi:hypothetical protein